MILVNVQIFNHSLFASAERWLWNDVSKGSIWHWRHGYLKEQFLHIVMEETHYLARRRASWSWTFFDVLYSF